MTTATAILQVLLTAAGARTLGLFCLRRLKPIGHPGLQIALQTSLGLLLVSHLIFAAALLSLAAPWFFYGLLAALGIAAASPWIGADWRAALARWRTAVAGVPGGAPVAGLGLAYAAFVVALAAPPPSAVDELVYHLEVPRQILLAGGTVLFPDNVYAHFPQLGEMLFTFGLAVGGEVAAKLFHALFAGLLALAIFGYSRQTLSRGWSLLAAGLFLSVPSVAWGASLAYVDLAFACYGFLALVCLLAVFRGGGWGAAVVAGLMAGGAWAVKYTGLQLTLLLLLVILVEHLASRRGGVPWAAAAFGAAAALPASPYLLRNWALTGWPLFPFELPIARAVFALDPRMNWDPERAQLFLRWLSGFGGGLEAGASEKLLSPLLVFFRARFDQPAAYDGVIGPVFLLIPLLLFVKPGKRGIPREAWILAGFSLAFLYYWSLTTQQVRFLLPAVPALAFLLAFGLQRRGTAWRAAAAVLLLAGAAMGTEKLLRAQPWAWWVGSESRELYLQKRVVGFRLYAEANRAVPSDDGRLFLVNMRNFGYLLDCPWTGDFVFEYFRLAQALQKAGSPEDVDRFFRELGISHLMIDERVTLSPLALEARELLLLKAFLRERTEELARDPSTPGLTLRVLAPR